MNIPETVRKVLDELVIKYPIDELIIFGSRAVGDHEPRSDFDIAVRATSISKLEFSKIRIETSEAPTLYWISLVHFNSTPSKLKARIIEQGITIYERSQNSR